MFVLKFFGLVAAMAVVVNAAPVDDPHPIHQLTPEEEAAQEAAFLAMSFEQRLEYHSEHKVYKPEGTVKCLVSTCTRRNAGQMADPMMITERVHRRCSRLSYPYRYLWTGVQERQDTVGPDSLAARKGSSLHRDQEVCRRLGPSLRRQHTV